MTETDHRLSPTARVAAGLAGGAAVVAGTLGTYLLVSAGSWIFAAVWSVGGVVVGAVFFQAAYRGEWRPEPPARGDRDDRIG